MPDARTRPGMIDGDFASNLDSPGAAAAPARPGGEEVASHLSAVVEWSDDAIVSKDLDGIVQSWNPGAERLFGYTAEEMVGRSIRVVIPDEQQGEEDYVLERIRRGERVDHFETIRRRKDGSTVPISLTISPVRNADGQVIGASKIARDITDRRAAEEAVRSSMAMKDQFLGLVSHELRTPITSIVGNAQLLLRRGHQLGESAREQALGDLLTESQHLQRIVENLLVLTRIETGRELAHEPIDLGAAVRQFVDSSLRRRPDRPIHLEVRQEVPRAEADPVLLTVVLNNLIENADKYSPAGVAIEVDVMRDESGRPAIRIADRGIGIGSTDMERIFEPFYRTVAAQAQASGMGLGLAVCRRVIEGQRGSIALSPRPGGGCEVTFSLPAGEASRATLG